jgi:acetyl esterase/lipase
MRREDYPPQEPLSEAGEAYGAECWRRSEPVAFDEYAFGPDPYQRLLVAKAGHPDGRVLLFWHGGGWTSGYKEWMAFMAPAFTANGVTFVSAGYRLAPQHVFPTAAEDCVRAVEWVTRNIAAHGGDPQALFIGGHSAGGHYAALLAVDERWLKRHGPPRETVRGCLPISAVFEFGPGSGLSMRPRFLGADPGNDALASPLLHLREAPPPFLVAYGTRDFPHLVTQGARFATALRESGADVEELPLPERTHFTASYAGGEADGPWVPRALAFMAKHRRG